MDLEPSDRTSKKALVRIIIFELTLTISAPLLHLTTQPHYHGDE